MADKGRELSGSVSVSAFRRLGESLESDAGEVHATLRFGCDDAGRRVLTGHLQAELTLVCQRCLSPYVLKVAQALEFVLVDNEAEARTLPDELDPVLIDGKRTVHTVDLLEDELILALPMIPRCGRGEACVSAVDVQVSDEPDAAHSAPED